MVVAAFAIAVGLTAGLLLRSPYRHLAAPRLRGWALLVAGVAAQAIAAVGAEAILVPLSYVLLVAFALRNLHLVGMPIVLLGLTLNGLVIGLNGAMPVRGDALVAAGVVEAGALAAVDLGPKRHLEESDDRLTFLGDAVPVPALGRVVSFGDLVLAVGLGNVVAHLVRRRRPKRDPHEGEHGWTTADDDALANLLRSERLRTAERAGAG